MHDRYGLYQTRSICLRVVVLNVMTYDVPRALLLFARPRFVPIMRT